MTLTPENMSEQLIRQASRAKVKKLIDTAVKYGTIKRGWTAADYMKDAVFNYGWESTGITGPKGSAKSNLLMQRGYIIYEKWEKVRRHMVTTREQFLNLLEDAIENEYRIPWLGVDDIATIFPSSLYFTDRKLHSELKSAWETLRTVMSNFDWTATRKNKVASFITEDITGDIITYNRRGEIIAYYDYRRWLWLRNLKDPTQMIAKLISVEDIAFPLTPDSFKIDKTLSTGNHVIGGETYAGLEYYKNKVRLTGVPRAEFVLYWNQRLGLAKDAYQRFRKVVEESKIKEEKKAEKEAMTEQQRIERAKNAAAKRWAEYRAAQTTKP